MSIDFFRGYDLNLLLLLHVLLVERSVTRAARQLGITQSAASRSLRRLREQLGDELLVRTSSGMVPTPRALDIKDPLEELLHQLGMILEPAGDIVPDRLERQFTIATADYPTAVLVPPLLALLRSRAPGCRLCVEALASDTTERLIAGEIDMVIAPKHRAAAGIVWSPVLRDAFVTIVRKRHPRIRTKPTLRQFLAEDHVLVTPERGPTEGIVDRALAAKGHNRRITLRLPSFSVAASIISRSDLVATLPEGAARLGPRASSVSVYPPPIRLASRIVTSMGWHERVRRDPVHAWFRDLVVEAATA